MNNSLKGIEFAIQETDALQLSCDVLALKYADAFYGVDEAAANTLTGGGVNLDPLLPKPSGFRLIPSRNLLAAKAVLFVGVGPLRQFGYEEIRHFGRKVLTSLAGAAPDSRHVCLTVHGPGYGLDEREAFAAELAGLGDALGEDDFPRALEKITIVERNPGRARRLRSVLNELIPISAEGEKHERDRTTLVPSTKVLTMRDALLRLKPYGRDSNKKPSIFVAMPFAEDMDNVFHFGIEGPVQSVGFLCERADLSVFQGDIVQWIRARIANSSLVIADLSSANPNVYLEVGYAWGRGKPTVLLVRDSSELKFDVKTQRCIVYNKEKIKLLEQSVTKELKVLKESGTI
jgi:hypothetical protein